MVRPASLKNKPAVDITVSTTIERPVATVARFVSDPDNAPRWYANIESVTWETPRPLVVGSRFRFVARFLGRQLEYTYEVAELVPLERMVMRMSAGPFPMETTYEWEKAGPSSTRMTLRNRGSPSGFSRLAAPMVSRAVKKATEKDLACLKSVLERSSRDER
jgi:uncharacterized protein YndB with AHSA1/START domain